MAAGDLGTVLADGHHAESGVVGNRIPPHIARLRGCAVETLNVTCFLMACEMHFLELAALRQVLLINHFSKNKKTRSIERALCYSNRYFFSSAFTSAAGATVSTHSRIALCEASPLRWPSLMMRV